MRVCTNFRSVALTAGALLAVGLSGSGSARAEQIVLFDITYTHTAANDSHYSISGMALNQPANWTAPINYAQGTIHFYQEVMTKPSNKPTIIDFCLISARDYGCIETFVYTSTGLVETTRSMAGKDVDKRAVIDFTQKMRSIQMVLKTPAPTYINGGSPKSDFLPSMMRFAATLVSPGGTYIKPMPTPGFNPGDAGVSGAPDGGVAPAVDAAAASPDAAPTPVATDAGASPPVVVDASSKPAPPTTKLDAAPKATPPTTEPPDETSEPAPAARASGGCTVGGGTAGGGLLALFAALALGLTLLPGRRTRRS